MGFIGSDQPKEVRDFDAGYRMLCSGDTAGAWFALGRDDPKDPAHARHNRSICLLAAGRREEALEAARGAFRSLTEGVPQRSPDAVGEILIRKRTGPGPMDPSLPSVNPTYAGLLARWQLCVCLLACGMDEEAASVASPLDRYGIVPVWEETE